MTWRQFPRREVVAALEWAKAGNVAVHFTGLPFRHYQVTAHLFARDEVSLMAAARSLGCLPVWIQRKSSHVGGPLAGHYLTHFDLFGARLTKALARCGP